MSSPILETLLGTAQQRANTGSLPYAGALTPSEAFKLLGLLAKAILIDVRTQAERDWVGRVAIPEHQHAAIEWNLYPGGTRNPDFLTQLSEVAAPEQILLFLCRSSVRSRQAAALATASGYRQCFDVLEGFEGDKDNLGHRKNLTGWCAAGLPWVGA